MAFHPTERRPASGQKIQEQPYLSGNNSGRLAAERAQVIVYEGRSPEKRLPKPIYAGKFLVKKSRENADHPARRPSVGAMCAAGSISPSVISSAAGHRLDLAEACR